MSAAGRQQAINLETEETISPNKPVVGRSKANQVIAKRRKLQHLNSHKIDLHQSMAGVGRTNSLTAQQSVIGLNSSIRSSARNSAVGVNVAGNMELHNVAAQWIVGGNIQAKRVLSLAVIGGNVQGEIRALMGPRAAIAFGVALGLSGLATRLIKWLLK